MKNKLFAVLAHAAIVLAVATLVLIILDYYNPMLGFTDSPYSRVVLYAALAVAAVLGVAAVVKDRKAP